MKLSALALWLFSSLVQTGEDDASASAAGATPAGSAPGSPSLGAALGLVAPANVSVEVDTSAGVISGTMALTRVIGRGLGGSGPFELVCEVDPLSLRTGDDLRDRLLRRQLFGERPETLRFASYTRVGREDKAGDGTTTLPAMAMGFWQTPHGQVRLDAPYGFEPAASGGTLTVVLESQWSDLALPEPEHPFVRVTGPVRVTLRAPLSN